MAEPAIHAWGHCLAVLRAPAPAERTAVVALRHGGRSRSSVLAHARAAALAEAAANPPPEPAGDEPLAADLDLVGLASLLAGTRPATERAVIDLDGRLDRGQLARALGLSAAGAADRAAEVAAAWDQSLDPALLAWLGPGDCAELAVILGWATEPSADDSEDPPVYVPGESAPRTLGELMTVVGAVAEHADGCDVCSDRRRAMVSVRALQARVVNPPPPAAVRAAATAGRFRLPGPLPPPIDAALGPPQRGRGRVGVAVGVAVVALIAVAAALIWRHHDSTSSANPLAALPKTGNGLALSPAEILPGGAATLQNTSSGALTWQATTSAAWLQVNPTSGRLDPGASVTIAVTSLSSAPPGGAHATVSVAGSDGSAAAADVTAGGGQLIDLAATLDGCTVRAQVVDTVDANVTLVYRAGPTAAEQTLAMTGGPASYTATLPAGNVTWWVSAADSRGGTARTDNQTLTAATCPPG